MSDIQKERKAWRDEITALQADNERLREALKHVNEILTIPAAEYVPAIPDAWAVIEAALKGRERNES